MKNIYEFLIFSDLFHESLGELNNTKIYIFVNIARGNVR